MRIFLTGATGYIGSAVLDALVRGGHDVTALVRDNEKARRAGETGRAPCADPGGAAQDGRLRRRAGARPGGPQPACACAGLDADAPLGRGQCRAAARRVARLEKLRIKNYELRIKTVENLPQPTHLTP